MKQIPLFSVNMPSADVLMPRLQEVLYSGYIGQGPRVEEFEREFGTYIGNQNVLSLNSGTSALHLAYRLAEVKGGEVITTPMTCTATNMPILANGADIVWADVDPQTGMLDPLDVERKITKRTRAITVVHWGGVPAELDELNRISKKHGIPLIEDAAHALGAEYKGRKIGSGTADFTIFSLQAIKHITTIDGGVLAVRDSGDYKRGKLLRWYGIDRETERKDFRCEEDISEWGYKFHMNDVTATIGLVQLEYLDQILEAHRDTARFYAETLPQEGLGLPSADDKAAWWLYTLRLAPRDIFFNVMKEWNVQVSQVHARNDTHTAFREFQRNPLPGLDEFASRMVCIPIHAKLTEKDRQQVKSAVTAWLNLYRMGP